MIHPSDVHLRLQQVVTARAVVLRRTMPVHVPQGIDASGRLALLILGTGHCRVAGKRTKPATVVHMQRAEVVLGARDSCSGAVLG